MKKATATKASESSEGATTPERRLEWMPLERIKPAAKNPKKHDLVSVGTSVARFGYVEPMVLDERTGRLVAGHGRRMALMKMRAANEAPPEGVRLIDGQWCAPVLRGWASRSDTEAEAYLGVMADPRSPRYRLHHDINWNRAVPKILREEHRKE